MRNFKHLTPRYIFNRLAVLNDEKKHPSNPWLPKDSVNLLSNLLRKSDVGVEFGSGRSTHWFLSKIDRLTSVETDRKWFDKIKIECQHEIKNGRLEYVYAITENDFLSLIEKIEVESIDFCLVDGAHRDLCAVHMVEKIKVGGMIVVDNINWFIPCPNSVSPNTRKESDGCESELWSNFLKGVSNWRYIWTSNGVTDTSIWIRK